MSLNEKDILELQLQRKIDNFIEVVKYCPFSFPAVVLVDPYKNKIPAPTIYWLSCPYLNYEVDKIEDSSSLLSELSSRLNSDKEFKDKMDEAHKLYAEARLKLLDSEKLQKAAEVSDDLLVVLKKSGVGGIRDKMGIKCLHTHLAHYLAGGDNPSGKIIFSKLNWPEECEICRERIDLFESGSS